MERKDLERKVERFLAEIAAMTTLKGRGHTLGEDLGDGCLREFLMMCGSNNVRVHVSITRDVGASFGEHYMSRMEGGFPPMPRRYRGESEEGAGS